MTFEILNDNMSCCFVCRSSIAPLEWIIIQDVKDISGWDETLNVWTRKMMKWWLCMWSLQNIELSLVNQPEKRWWVIGTRRREIHWNLHFAFTLPIFLIYLQLWIFTKTSWRVLMIWISAIYGTESAYSVDALTANHLCSRFLKQSISERIVSPQLLFFALRIKRVTWQVDASQASLFQAFYVNMWHDMWHKLDPM